MAKHPYILEYISVEPNPKSGSADYMNFKDPAKNIQAIIHDTKRRIDAWERVHTGAPLSANRIIQQASKTAFAYVSEDYRDTTTAFWTSPLDTYIQGIRNAADLMRQIQDDWVGKIFNQAFFNSDLWAHLMIQRGLLFEGDTQVNDQLNYGFFTHNYLPETKDKHGKELNGTLNRVNIDAIVDKFRSENPDYWPNLLLNSNHALIRDHLDISGIMKGFHALASYCFADNKGKGRDLNLMMRHDMDGPEHNPQRDRQKETIMLSAVFNNYNAWVNGGTLLMRLNHMDKVHRKEASGDMDPKQREREYIGQGYSAMSPASVMLAKLILKLIVENPDKIKVPTRHDFEQVYSAKGADNPVYQGDLTKALINSDEPILIRKDADKILQHILPQGYSKGGSIVTDAIDFLRLDLQRQRSQAVGGGPIFQVHQKGQKKPREITDDDIAALTFNMGILTVNSGITPLNAYQKKMGMRRLTIRNVDDYIARHLYDKPIMKAHLQQPRDGRDDVYTVKPKEPDKELGHGFISALGSRDADDPAERVGYVIDPEKQEIVSDHDQLNAHEVRSRVRVIHAACYNALGVSNIIEEPDGHSYRMEFSRGASKSQIEHLQQALSKKLTELRGGTIMCDLVDTDVCMIQFDAHMSKELQHKKLAEALESLAFSKKMPGSPELFVGDHVYTKLDAIPPHVSRGRAA